MPVTLYDTAGIRKTNNIIEKKGIELATSIMKKSDLILNLCENGNFNLNILEKNLLNSNETMIINVKTKADINKKSNKKADLEISSKTNYGINFCCKNIFLFV